MESYLQKAWGDSIDNPTISDIKTAIKETLEMDDEHGAFWVSIVEDDETVLQTQKDLSVTIIFPEGIEITSKPKNTNQVETLYGLFLNKEFKKVTQLIRLNP